MAQRANPREKALEILKHTEEGTFADSLLDQSRKDFDTRDNAFILEIVYGILRNRTRLDWVLDCFSAQPVAKTDIWTRNILRLGAYQMLFLDRVPVSAAVNTSTELAKTHGKKDRYVNGLLRNLDRKRATVIWPDPVDRVKQLSVLYSHPAWLVRRWVTRFNPDIAETLLRENNRPAPLIIRTNTLKTTRDKLKESLATEGVIAIETAYSPVGLEITSGAVITSLTSYRDGWFMVQDQAAQLVSLLLAPQPGETVLDACAAPGGKATHIAELMKDQGKLVALESDPARVRKISENSARLGITCIISVTGDAAAYRGEVFDRILIDAPCSGLGVLRRHPDGRWNKQEHTIRERQALQSKILENCADLLKPGGILVYATCTTEPEENEEVIKAFLDRQGVRFAIEDPRPFLPSEAARFVNEAGYFHTFPNEPSMDGFFGVRLAKKK